MKLVIDIPEGDYNYIKDYGVDAFVKFAINNNYTIEKLSQYAEAIKNGTPLPKCMDCRFFEYDFVARAYSPLILSHEICKKWGDGCKTREDGYCFLFEAKEGAEECGN